MPPVTKSEELTSRTASLLESKYAKIGVELGLPSGRISVPIFRPNPDRIPGRVSVPRLGIDPPVPTLKTDPIRQEPEF